MSKPFSVRKNQIAGNAEGLRAQGKKGAETTNKKSAQKRIEDEMLDMARAEEMIERRNQAGEDILPPSVY
jgi:hypothetical protein